MGPFSKKELNKLEAALKNIKHNKSKFVIRNSPEPGKYFLSEYEDVTIERQSDLCLIATLHYKKKAMGMSTQLDLVAHDPAINSPDDYTDTLGEIEIWELNWLGQATLVYERKEKT